MSESFPQLQHPPADTPHSDGYRIAKQWAAQSELWPQLHFITVVFQADHRPELFGTVLGLFNNEEARTLCERWVLDCRGTSIALPLCHRLAEHDGAAIFQSYPRLSKALSPTREFKKTLRRDFLIAVAAEQDPPGSHVSTEVQTFFRRARLWLVAHALRLGLRGILADQNLRLVAQFLREAGDAVKLERTRLLADLAFPIEYQNFTRLNRDFARSAEQILATNPTLAPALRRFLRAICDLARHIDRGEAQETGEAAFPKGILDALASRVDNPQEALEFRWLPRDDGYHTTIIPGDGEDSDDITAIDTNPYESIAQQQYSSRSVLLWSREDAQNLVWSWGRPTAAEFTAISSWLTRAINSPEPSAACLAAHCWIALVTAQSLTMAQAIPIDNDSHEGWSLDRDFNFLHRLPPRRQGGWKAKASSADDLLRPYAEFHQIALPGEATHALQRESRKSTASPPATLGQCWPTAEYSPATLFNETSRKEGFGRVTQGMLGSWLAGAIMSTSGNHVATRLATSHPNTGLPGSCAYASWDAAEVQQIFSEVNVNLDAGPIPAANALGSQLDPIEAHLAIAIEESRRALESEIENGDLITAHNAFVTSVLMILFAETGARPCNDPFESLSCFNLDDGFVFLSEKDAGTLRNSRLVPVSHSVRRHLEQDFLPYLLSLAAHLRGSHPALGRDIDNLTAGKSPAALPLFFFLKANVSGELEWASVTKSYLDRNFLPGTGLPAYVFRHRFSRWLHHAIIDPEIIDALLAHTDAGTPTHGYESPRIWIQDMATARPCLEACFEQSMMQPLAAPNLALPNRVIRTDGIPIPDVPQAVRPFGDALRAKERRRNLAATLQDARAIIEVFLDGRTLDQLDAEEIDTLSKRLLFTDSGRPHPSAGLRYRVLLKQIDALWKKEGKFARRRRHYLVNDPGDPFFTPTAVGALGAFDRGRHQFDQLRATVSAATGSFFKAWLGVIGLSLESRVADRRLLFDVLSGFNFRIVVLAQRCYLERLPALGTADRDNDASEPKISPLAAFRIAVSPHVASWLTSIRLENSGSAARRSQRAIPDSILSLLNAMGISGEPEAEAAIKQLCAITDQVNKLTCPGIVAGYLAGHQTSFPLGWNDWVRVTTGRSIAVESYGENAQEEEYEFDVNIAVPASCDESSLRANARKLIGELRKIMRTACAPKTATRRNLVTQAGSAVDKYRGRVSTSISTLGYWITNVLKRINKVASAERYLSALSGLFENVMWNFDLAVTDSDELTEKYEELLNAGNQRHRAFVVDRLRNFHRFARTALEIEDPDWSELPVGDRIENGRPGLIRESEYHAALLRLNTNLEPERARMACMILLLVYRFGLRPDEARGLSREDLVPGKPLVVVVRNNAYRKLKRPASRRLVPLLFKLDMQELALVDRVSAEAEAASGENLKAPLLGKLATDAWISSQVMHSISSVLKMETRSKTSVLYDCRHTFAMRIAQVVYEAALNDPIAAELDQERYEAAELTRCLLGTTGISRRGPWALARLLGHASPTTAIRSYVNFMDSWADSFIDPAARETLRRTTAGMHDLEKLPDAKTIPESVPIPKSHELTMPDVIKFIRVVSRGASPERTALRLNFDPDLFAPVIDGLCEIAMRGLSLGQREETDGLQALREMLGDIPAAGWSNLLQLSDDVDMQTASTSFAKQEMPCVARLSGLVGHSRQLLLWRREDFVFVRNAFKSLGIPAQLYEMTGASLDHEIQDWANANGFALTDSNKLKGFTQPAKIDALMIENGRITVNRRCAVLFQRNSEFPLKTRVMLVVALIAWALKVDRKVENTNRGG